MPYTDPDKQRIYQRNWMRMRRNSLIQALGGKCAIRGTTECLEFHHIEPSKKECNVSSVVSRKLEASLPELAKCELRCSAHHKSAHSASHGHTLWRRGCRCGICVLAGEKIKKTDREMKREKRKADPFYGRSKPMSLNGSAPAS